MTGKFRFTGPKAGDMTPYQARMVKTANKFEVLSAVVGVPKESTGPAEVQIFLELGCRCDDPFHQASIQLAACLSPERAKVLAEGILASLGSERFKATE